MRRLFGALILFALLATAYFYGRDYVRRHPQDVPWTKLRLDDPIGRFTLRKLAALTSEPAQCRALLAEAGVDVVPAPRLDEGANCGYSDGVRLYGETEDGIAFPPGRPVTSCPIAAATHVWVRQVVQPAALELLGSPVVAIGHAGSYSCRRINGREDGRYSEHATADAIDITGFSTANGQRISVLRDWDEGGVEARFLRRVRDGACGLFATTLSPEYNEAHADHFHLDQAERGRSGFGLCA